MEILQNYNFMIVILLYHYYNSNLVMNLMNVFEEKFRVKQPMH